MARVFGGQCAAVRMDALGRRLLRDGRVLLPSTAANGTGGGTLSQETTKHTKSTENIGESSISCFSCVSWLLFQNNPPGSRGGNPAARLDGGRSRRRRPVRRKAEFSSDAQPGRRSAGRGPAASERTALGPGGRRRRFRERRRRSEGPRP